MEKNLYYVKIAHIVTHEKDSCIIESGYLPFINSAEIAHYVHDCKHDNVHIVITKIVSGYTYLKNSHWRALMHGAQYKELSAQLYRNFYNAQRKERM